jgi:hypothetical protein
MNSPLLAIIKSFLRLSYHYIQVGKLFQGFNSPSYNQDKTRLKPKVSQFLDYLYLFFVLRVLPSNYHLFQFDTKPRELFKEYMDEPSSPSLRHKMYAKLWDDAYSSLVNDKYVFHCICQHHHLPVPKLYGVIRKGTFIVADSGLPTIHKGDEKKVVVKPARGMQGKGIYFVNIQDISDLSGETCACALPEGFREAFLSTDFVVQELIRQHPLLDNINPHSLNTIRIITLRTSVNKAEVLAAMLRTSSDESPVDNFSTGGIVVGIDMDTGNLNPAGFLKTPYGTTVSSHPVTGTQFSHVQIPYWQEVKEVAAKAQQEFYQLKAIGWDFAITKDGPVLIEGNIEWGTAGIQAATGGLLIHRNRELFARWGLRFYE